MTARPIRSLPRHAEVFPPTLREVLLRPRWLALLVLCLVVAGVFAWLGQWQLGRAIDTDPTPPGATEEVLPLAEVAAPGQYVPEPLVGQRVTVTGTWVPEDFIVVSSRFNDGVEGYWVTGQLRVADTGAAGVGRRRDRLGGHGGRGRRRRGAAEPGCRSPRRRARRWRSRAGSSPTKAPSRRRAAPTR